MSELTPAELTPAELTPAELTPAELAGARFRCARGALAEPLAGTAAHDTAYLLIEHPGPWGHKALAESRLPEHVRSGLADARSEEHTSELQSLMRNSYAVFCLKTTNSTQKN